MLLFLGGRDIRCKSFCYAVHARGLTMGRYSRKCISSLSTPSAATFSRKHSMWLAALGSFQVILLVGPALIFFTHILSVGCVRIASPIIFALARDDSRPSTILVPWIPSSCAPFLGVCVPVISSDNSLDCHLAHSKVVSW